MDKYFKRGVEYMQCEKLSKAINQFELQLKERKFKECWLNLAMCYKQLNNFGKATECLLQSIHETTPFSTGEYGCYPQGLHNLGAVSYALGSDHNAQAFYKLAVECDPRRQNSIMGLALAQLRMLCSRESLDWLDVWQNYFARFFTTQPVKCDLLSVPLWDFVKPHRRCVVLREQGYGDQLQFSRYLPQLKHYFSEIVLESLGSLDPLFSDYEICEAAATSKADVAIPIMSLAHKFGLESNGAWLQNKPIKPRVFAQDKLNIGIEWQGSQQHKNDYNRSCNPELFQQLRRPDIQLYSIRPNAEPQPGVIALNSQSWLESCEIVCGLDLVVSVDTSIVHLAGCLNRPCWLLQPLYETDWRWGSDSLGLDNVWYKSVEVVRNPHNWQVVFSAVSTKLDQMLTQKRYKMMNKQLQQMLDQMQC